MKRIPACIGALILLPISHVSAQTVTVTEGQSLWSIAQTELGDPLRWRELCVLNEATLGDCNRLRPGTTILLPAVADDAETAPDPEDGADEDQSSASQPEAGDSPAESSQSTLPVSEPVRTNLIANQDFADAYWAGYWLKPEVSGGVPDPLGGNDAYEVASADSPDRNASGFLRAQALEPGTYTLGVWLRSTTGNITLNVGLADGHGASIEVGEDWQYVQRVVEVTEPIVRTFQIWEAQAGNAPWQIFGVSVEEGRQDAAFPLGE